MWRSGCSPPCYCCSLRRAALWRVALGAILGMVAVWMVFQLALGVRLPTGDFWEHAQRLSVAPQASQPVI